MNPTDIHGREIQVGDKVTIGDKRKIRGRVKGFDGTKAIVTWGEGFQNWDPLIDAALLEVLGTPTTVLVPSPVELEPVAVAEKPKAIAHAAPPEPRVAPKEPVRKAPPVKSHPAKGHAHPGNGKSHAKAKHGRK